MLSGHSPNFSTWCDKGAALQDDRKSAIQIFLELRMSGWVFFFLNMKPLSCWITQLHPGQSEFQINLDQTAGPAKDLQIKAMSTGMGTQ